MPLNKIAMLNGKFQLFLKLFIGILLLATSVYTYSQSIILSTPVAGDPAGGGNDSKVYSATSAGTGNTYFKGDNLEGLTIDKEGNVGFCSGGSINKVSRFDAANSSVIQGPVVTGLLHIAIDPAAEYIYASGTSAISRSVWTDNGENTSFGHFVGSAPGVVTKTIQIIPFLSSGDWVYLNGASVTTALPAIGEVYGMTFDATGNLYFTDKTHHNIKKVSMVSYTVTELASKDTKTLTLSSVSAIKVGDLVSGMYIPKSTYVIAISGNTVTLGQSITATINSTTGSIAFITGVDIIAGSALSNYGNNDGIGASAKFNSPMGIVFDLSGNLYICDNVNNKIRKITATNGAINSSSLVSTMVTTSLNGAAYITIDQYGSNLYMSDLGQTKIIYKVPLLNGQRSVFLGAGIGNLGIHYWTKDKSSTVTNEASSSIIAGMYITGSCIPAGAKVGSIISPTKFSITNFAGAPLKASGTATEQLATFASADGPLKGDGVLGNPLAMAISPLTGELYFVDAKIGVVRKASTPALFFTTATDSWSNNATWEGGIVPSGTNDAYIRNDLTVDANCSIANLSVIPGITITIAAGVTLNVSGDLINRGVISGPGKISLNGLSEQTLYSGLSGTGVINNLDINNSYDVTLSGYLNVTGLLSVTKGQLYALGFLTLKSTAANTASIGKAGASDILSNVSVERYIPSFHRKNYCLVSSPVRSPTINTAWQESGEVVPGYGTHITGAAAGSGFDAVSAGGIASIYTYDDTKNDGSKWVGLTNTDKNVLMPGIGYLLYVRGDRSEPRYITPFNSSHTTLRATGKLALGDITITTPVTTVPIPAGPSLTAGKNLFSLIANPYACAIQWSDNAKVVKTNITSTFWVYDPNLSVFVSYNGSIVSPSGSQQQANIIQSGEAFFIQNDESGAKPSITFTEAAKTTAVSTSSATTVFGDVIPNPQLNFNIYSTQDSVFADGVVAVYGDNYLSEIDKEDAAKMDNFAETFSLLRENKKLSIEGRPLIKGKDTLFLDLANFANKEYSLQIEGKNFNDVTAKLEDRYTHTQLAIDLTGTTSYKFAVSNDTASAGADRLLITFNTKAIAVIPDPIGSIIPFFTVSPNPVSDQLQVRFKTATIENTIINIINSAGQTVKTVDAGKTAAATLTIAAGSLPAGLYIVQLVSGDKKVDSQKIIVN